MVLTLHRERHMNFQTHQLHRVDTSQLDRDDGFSEMPAAAAPSHVETASREDEDSSPPSPAAYGVGLAIIAAIVVVVYIAWRAA